MDARRITGLLLLTITLLSTGCAAPYIHRNAVLGLSTADMMDSRFEQEALMFTLSVPMKPKINSIHEHSTLTPDEQSKPADY